MDSFAPEAGARRVGRLSGTDADPVADLPVDPDLEVDETRTGDPRPVHVQASSLTIVFVGGAIGAAAREGLTLADLAAGQVPWTIVGINVTGAFLLGILLHALARRGPDHGRRRALRLLIGTGFMGGFTTYSTLATDTATLLGNGSISVGVGYAVGTVLLGAVATWAGMLLAALAHRARMGRSA